jgi:hypothetical protein
MHRMRGLSKVFGTVSDRKNEWNGWGGRIRTCAWRYQKPLPYRLATPHHEVNI